MKTLIIFILSKLGYQIQKISENKSDVLTMNGALERCVKRGLHVNTVIDIGASDGRWSKECMKFLPNARYLLIEALQAHKKNLAQFKIENPQVDYKIAAAGRKEGLIYFFDNGSLFGGVASEKAFNKSYVEVPAVSIDDEIKKRQLKPPYLLKLDTHGFEIPILEGATETIKNAELIIIETYNHQLTDDTLKYYQMSDYMEKLGFSTVEIVDVMLRDYDNSLWQMDTFFIPSVRKEFASKAFHK
jgi:FkbM family methyltransferase